MAVFLVTWDLNKEGAEYNSARAAFLRRVGQYENISDSSLDSVRFIATDQAAATISDDLRQALDPNDRLIVTRLFAGHHGGWLARPVWEWINARL